MTAFALPDLHFPRRNTRAARDRHNFAKTSAVTTRIRAEERPARTEQVTPVDRIILNCSDDGHWTLTGQGLAAREFSSFDEALDDARRSSGSKTGTVEVWQFGEYICCLPLNKWRPNDPSHGSGLRGPARTATERYANRVAEIIFATAGPLFWLALVFVALAASLGWRLLLL
jgi:hypothetical protein